MNYTSQSQAKHLHHPISSLVLEKGSILDPEHVTVTTPMVKLKGDVVEAVPGQEVFRQSLQGGVGEDEV